MLSIMVIEDEWKIRKRIESFIESYISMENLDAALEFSTGNPAELLDYVKYNRHETSLYFIDIDLKNSMSGLLLASELRKIDHIGKIVFVTNHGEHAFLTFTYKLEAMDYIIKNDLPLLQNRICECIKMSIERFTSENQGQRKLFKVKVGDTIRTFPEKDILFFESAMSSHKVSLHLDNSEIEFYGSLKAIEADLGDFIRCHKSYLINRNHIAKLKKKERLVEMSNGEKCLVSVRAMKYF